MGGPGGPGAAPGGGNIVVANPTYTSLVMDVDVNRPAAEVWKRVGKFCDIGEWMGFPCTITSGKDGEVGAVRNIGREVLVGKTDLSYTYTQPVTAGQPYILYHGTLEAKPLTSTTTKLIYTLMWDNSTCADDAAREADRKAARCSRAARAVPAVALLHVAAPVAPVVLPGEASAALALPAADSSGKQGLESGQSGTGPLQRRR
jgi:hypothetical protein